MTKKHFIALADALRNNGVNEFEPQVIEILADFCQSRNPRLNCARWITYIHGECGPNGGKLQ